MLTLILTRQTKQTIIFRVRENWVTRFNLNVYGMVPLLTLHWPIFLPMPIFDSLSRDSWRSDAIWHVHWWTWRNIWTRSMGTLRASFIRWSPFFFMLTMLFWSLDQEQAYMNKLHEFALSSSLEVNLSKTKIMMFGCNRRNINQVFLSIGSSSWW